MLKGSFFIIPIVLLLIGCSFQNEDSIFSWVDSNNHVEVEKWLNNGGNPNLKTKDGESLLYIATGPHGGNEVLRVLLKHKVNVNEGQGKYTPLMNAASWINYEAVTWLLNAGADATLKNENGQSAIDVIGNGDDKNEQLIREALENAIKSNK